MLPLLAAQRSMYLFEKRHPKTTTYHHTAAMEITGPINQSCFLEAFKLLMQRHEALRTRIINSAGQPSLEILPYDGGDSLELPVSVIRVPKKYHHKVEQAADVLKKIGQEGIINTPFDFNKGPLWRTVLLEYAPNKYQLVLVLHHLIVDIWSQNIILRDLSEIYNALLENRSPQLPDIPKLSENHFVEDKPEQEDKLNYWKKQLDHLTPLMLERDYPSQDFRFLGDRVYFSIPPDILKTFQTIADKNQSSIPSVILSSIFALLYRYTSETDICLGIASANRRGYEKNANDQVNCFINSVPLRILVDKNASFEKLVQNVTNVMKTALQKQVPLDLIIQEAMSLETKTALNQATPFSVLCNFNKEKKTLQLSGTKATYPVELNLGHSKFENFGINVDLDNGEAFVEFNTDLFKKEFIQALVNHLQVMWSAIAKQPKQKVSELPILTNQEKKLLNKFHHENKKATPHDFLHLMFSRNAEKHSHETAIVFHGENQKTRMMTYAELEKKSNNLAAYLRNIGIGPEKTVGVCLNRSIELVIAILAIMKAGGVVVPLENKIEGNPKDALLYHKIKDAAIDTVLVDNETISLFKHEAKSKTPFCLNIEDPSYLQQVKKLGLKYQPPSLTEKNLAYIMYTSGTTGVPKGVMIEHGSLNNLAYAIKDRQLPLGSKVLITAPPTFDCFFFELLEWLAVENELHMINEKERLSPLVLERVIRNYQINCVTLLPDIIKNLNPNQFPSLMDVISMGASPHPGSLDLWHSKNRKIRQEYGPTEGTVCITNHPYRPGESYNNIGKPIRNAVLYIMREGSECPPNLTGELYIEGPIARGYLGKEDLTQQKFPLFYYHPDTHTWNHEPSANANVIPQRLYATGDLARYSIAKRNMSIEFVERKEDYRKVHGILIERKGIEDNLRKHPAVQDVAITLHESKDYLLAYIVPKAGHPIEEFDDYVESLPVPLKVITLSELPLNKNGKVDFKALANIHNIDSPEFTTPQTDLQKKLCQIWKSILHCDHINMHKTFRQHGGDSLSLAILETKLIQYFPRAEEKVSELLNKKITILKLEELIKVNNKRKLSESVPKTYQDNSSRTLFGNVKTDSPNMDVQVSQSAPAAKLFKL